MEPTVWSPFLPSRRHFLVCDVSPGREGRGGEGRVNNVVPLPTAHPALHQAYWRSSLRVYKYFAALEKHLPAACVCVAVLNQQPLNAGHGSARHGSGRLGRGVQSSGEGEKQ